MGGSIKLSRGVGCGELLTEEEDPVRKHENWYFVDNCMVRQNTLFKTNQSQLYKELGSKANSGPTQSANASEAMRFSNGIWSVEKRHNEDACWLDEVRDRIGNLEKQEKVKINVEDVENGIDGKLEGSRWCRGVWFERFKSFHGLISESLQGCLDSGEVRELMVKGRMVLIQKDHAKGTVAGNYRQIACLPLMWKR